MAQRKRLTRLPGAVVHAEVDVRTPGPLAGPTGVPGPHVARGTDGMFRVEHGSQPLGVLLPNRLPEVLHHARHVEREDNPAAQFILEEEWRRDLHSVRSQEPLDQPDQLREQVLPAAFPRRLHLVEHLGGCLEGDLPHPELPAQLGQADFRQAGNVGLAVDDRRQFGQGQRMCLIHDQMEHSSRTQFLESLEKGTPGSDFMADRNSHIEMLARAIAPVGWYGRGTFGEFTTDYQVLEWAIRWDEFCTDLRDAILGELRRAIARIAEIVGSRSRLVVQESRAKPRGDELRGLLRSGRTSPSEVLDSIL